MPIIKTLPNLITLARIIAVPFVVSLLLDREYQLAFWIFVLAGLSDGIDGYIAKHWDARTRLGAYMDPIADKALLAALFLTLGYQGVFESWLVVLVVGRDLAIIGAILLSSAMGYELEIRPHVLSKINTFAQLLFSSYLLFALSFELMNEEWVWYGTRIVAGTTLLSWLVYSINWISILGGYESDENEDERGSE